MVFATARTPRCLALAIAAWLVGACNQALGLEPVALAGDAAIAPLDAARCEPPAAADVEGGAAVDGVFAYGVAGAAWFGSRLFLVGTRDGRGNDGATAAIEFPAAPGATWATRALGGTGDDQLWTAAGSADALLAGGVTRSFHATPLDEGLLVGIDATGTMSTRRLRASVAIQVHAVAPATDGAWWVAGLAGGQHAMVARLTGSATNGAMTVDAHRFAIDGAQPRPRRVVDAPDDRDAPYVVGQLGDTAAGFVARVDTTPDGGDTSWAVAVPIEVFDAAWFDGSLWVAGRAGADGALLRFDVEGALRAAWRLLQRPLQRIDRRGATVWLGGATGDGVFVGTLAGDCVTGTDFASLTPAQPLPTRLPLEVGGAVPVLAGRVGTSARAIPLGEDATATCGVPFAAVREPTTTAATAADYVAATPVAMVHELVSAITAVVNLGAQPATCPGSR